MNEVVLFPRIMQPVEKLVPKLLVYDQMPADRNHRLHGAVGRGRNQFSNRLVLFRDDVVPGNFRKRVRPVRRCYRACPESIQWTPWKYFLRVWSKQLHDGGGKRGVSNRHSDPDPSWNMLRITDHDRHVNQFPIERLAVICKPVLS